MADMLSRILEDIGRDSGPISLNSLGRTLVVAQAAIASWAKLTACSIAAESISGLTKGLKKMTGASA